MGFASGRSCAGKRSKIRYRQRVELLITVSVLLLLLVFQKFLRHVPRWKVSEYGSVETTLADSHVTFVIPTIGRQSLPRALDSVLNQSVRKWKALVVFHSSIPVLNSYTYPPQAEEFLLYSKDTRIRFVTYTGGIRSNCAGDVRNFALQFVDTDWVAFLDDDDSLSPDYILHLLQETRLNPTAELVSFRMFDKRIADPNNPRKVLPEENATDAQRDHIGISFAFKQSRSRYDLFEKSTTEDFDFIHNFCYVSGRLCILSPYIVYYVKGQKPENRVSAGERTIIRALPSELQLGHVVASTVACYASSDQGIIPGTRVKITSSEEARTPKIIATSPLGLTLRLHDAVNNCSLNFEGVSNVHITLSFANFESNAVGAIFVIHSALQLAEVLRLPKQNFLWATSNGLKKLVLSAGFDATRIQVINPWNVLDVHDPGPCALRNAPFCSSAAIGEAGQPRVTLFDTRGNDVSGIFQRFCAQIQLAGFRATCLGNVNRETTLCACSADIVIFFFHDTVPEWSLVEYLILREKVVLFNSDRDYLLSAFFSKFAYWVDTPATALSTVVTMLNNWNFFSETSSRAATALRVVIDDSHHEEVCLALDEYAAWRARDRSMTVLTEGKM